MRIVASARRRRLVLQLEVLGEVQDELPGDRSGDLVVPVGDVLLDRDRRERRRVDVVGHPAQDVVGAEDERAPCRRPGGDDADTDADDRGGEQPDAQGDADDAVAPGSTGRQATSRTARSRRSPVCGAGSHAVEQGTARADDDEPAEQGDLGRRTRSSAAP